MKHQRIRLSKSTRMLRLCVLHKHIAVQFPVFHRPQFFFRYNDGESAFVDLGPLRLYRNFWVERIHHHA